MREHLEREKIQTENDEGDFEEDDFQYDENDVNDDTETSVGHHEKMTMTPKKVNPANLLTSPMDESPTERGNSLRGAD